MRLTRITLVSIPVVAALLIAALAAVINPALTRYVHGPGFRAALEKETAKGLHFKQCRFAPIERTGVLAATSNAAICRDGWKAMTSLDVSGLSAHFNPTGIFLRRWSIDDLQVERAEIGLQTYQPVPEPIPRKPWFALLLPDRVYLKHVWSNHADITWRLRGQRAGIFDTKLVITPHGRDFNYAASGGVLRNPLMPQLQIRQIHLLITKTLFALHDMDLASGKNGTIHADGTTATRGENKNVDFRFAWEHLPVSDWIATASSNNFKGSASGQLRWTGADYKLESAVMDGGLTISDGRVSGLKFLDQIAALTNHPDLRHIELDKCDARFHWEKSDIDLHDVVIEQHGKFVIRGDVTVRNGSLGGRIDLGLAREYLTWLPRPEEVFSREASGYLWTTVQLSGSLDAPRQDLSPRVVEALKESPAALLGAALRQLAEWLRGD